MWTEFGRALLFLIVILIGGMVLCLIMAMMNQLVGINVPGGSPSPCLGGSVFGYVTIFVVFPSLWTKNLVRAVPLAYGPAAVAAALSGAFMPGFSSAMMTGLVLTIGCLAVAFVVPKYWDVDRRGLCLQCGYDLRGNTTGLCPECGQRWRAA